LYKKITDDLYGARLVFCSGMSIEECQKKANRAFKIQEYLWVEKTDAASFYVCTTKDDMNIYVIWVKKSREIGTIIHEITHLVEEVFKDRGIPITYANSEAMAYYMQFFAEKILEPEKSNTKKKKKI